jgi:hypothetical protein
VGCFKVSEKFWVGVFEIVKNEPVDEIGGNGSFLTYEGKGVHEVV